MNPRLLEILRCSQCAGRLVLQVYERAADAVEAIQAGLLACVACDLVYAVWQGVPRMNLEEDFRLPRGFVAAYQDRLCQDAPAIANGKHRWAKNPYDLSWSLDSDGEFAWGGLDLTTRLTYFYHYLQVPPGSLTSQLILDAGCGNGVLSAGLAQDGPEVVAFDYSDIIVRAEANSRRAGQNGRVYYLQADVRQLPFAQQSFDVIYSDGVIHLTEDTRQTFSRLVRLVKPGGRLFVAVSRRDLSLGYRIRKILTDILQKLFRILPVSFGKPLCLAGAAVLSVYVRIMQWLGLKKKRPLGSLRQEALILWNIVALPRHQYHVPEEVAAWFREEGFDNVQDTTIPSLAHTGFGMLGIRRAEATAAEHAVRTT
jgi:SAM-dependent methyltransferase/uncharacterized protein YbaR (Trm112 family)